MPLKVTSRFETTVKIDDEMIPLSIKRFSAAESKEFNAKFEESTKVNLIQATEFIHDSYKKFLTVKTGHIYKMDSDTEFITSGEDFLEAFSARDELIVEVLGLIMLENKLSAPDKKRYYENRYTPAPVKETDKKDEGAVH